METCVQKSKRRTAGHKLSFSIVYLMGLVTVWSSTQIWQFDYVMTSWVLIDNFKKLQTSFEGVCRDTSTNICLHTYMSLVDILKLIFTCLVNEPLHSIGFGFQSAAKQSLMSWKSNKLLEHTTGLYIGKICKWPKIWIQTHMHTRKCEVAFGKSVSKFGCQSHGCWLKWMVGSHLTVSLTLLTDFFFISSNSWCLLLLRIIWWINMSSLHWILM